MYILYYKELYIVKENLTKNRICQSWRGRQIAMCAEKEPIQCHRTILVARAFDKLGFSVIHLMPKGITKDQREIDKELLEKYFPDIGQITMFEDQVSDEECLNAAYKKQNELIGYRLEEKI